ncbi:MAG: M1 family metallopeptidase, partial [Rhizobacter sp.]|nr:M1 family metallopeptidase [Chlorobiales bacterium]
MSLFLHFNQTISQTNFLPMNFRSLALYFSASFLLTLAACKTTSETAPPQPAALNAPAAMSGRTKRAPLTNESPFRRIEEWATPNEVRTGSGMPGKAYWQQRADYLVSATLDTATHRLTGTEQITYFNNSPDTLRYLWLQVDQNYADSTGRVQLTRPAPRATMPRQFSGRQFYGKYNISRVELVSPARTAKAKRSASKNNVIEKVSGTKTPAKVLINDTVMRIDLEKPLAPGARLTLEMDWSFIVPYPGRRMGREKVSGGWIYEMAQWQPRMCVYDDVSGWQTDQYMGQGEFYTEFGNWDVRLSVPASHIVIATGVLQNPKEVLTPEQQSRLARAINSEKTVMILDSAEVGTPASRPTTQGNLTWHFKAENTRDFAFATSQTYIWDAAGWEGVLCQSAYPKEALPLWRQSTDMVRFSVKEFSTRWFRYPYPVSANVNGPEGGMEYPMIVFCRERKNEFGLFGVTTHEVGHNWFPMIINSDERRYAWLDEGLTTFIQYYSEQGRYPQRTPTRGPAKNIVPYMKFPQQEPLMTHPHNVTSLGNNAYGKPAAGLVLLREQILGPERFDAAFREYCRRWAFKHPSPV